MLLSFIPKAIFSMTGAVLVGASACAASSNNEISIIPKPAKIERLLGQFVITPETVIVVDGRSGKAAWIGKYLAGLLKKPTGYSIAVVTKDQAHQGRPVIVFTTSGAKKSLGAEGYELMVSPESVIIRAPKPAGLFYGVQSLRQLLPVEIESSSKVKGKVWSVPCVSIEDMPRYGWRGMMVDVSRHFFPKETIKRFIDLMAYHKMNSFHWHLTDDNGWRVEIKKYPRLAEVAAWREQYGGNYGGFYTQDDIKEMVKYAADRFITIVPEIEMPGHSGEVMVAYPELSCLGGPFKPIPTPGGSSEVFCTGNEKSFEFIDGVISEVAKLFPGKYIHIGGDEVDKTRWNACPKCQKRMKDENLKDAVELQSYFIKRVEKIVNSNGKTLIGWDEILEGGLAPNAAVMSWRGMDGGIKASKDNHDVVMSPTSHCYFDYGQEGMKTLQNVYSFEPTPEALNPEQAKHILGAQGNLWSEFIKDQDRLDYQAFPRQCALAEVIWSPKSTRDWSDFTARMQNHYRRLDQMGVRYYVPDAEPSK